MRSTQHPTEPPPEGPSWSAGELISFGGLSDKGTGYMGYSERVGPSVLVLHDAYGLLSSVRSLTDRFVADGFTALAVDLYDGRTAEDAATAHRLGSRPRYRRHDEALGCRGRAPLEQLASSARGGRFLDRSVTRHDAGGRGSCRRHRRLLRRRSGSRAGVGRASSARALRARGRLRARLVSADGNERDGGCGGVRLRQRRTASPTRISPATNRSRRSWPSSERSRSSTINSPERLPGALIHQPADRQTGASRKRGQCERARLGDGKARS